MVHGASPRTTRRPTWRFYAGLWLAMMALRQDFWFWSDATLVLGFVPIGLAYQAAYSLLAAAVMAALVRYAWPADLGELDERAATEPSPEVRP